MEAFVFLDNEKKETDLNFISNSNIVRDMNLYGEVSVKTLCHKSLV